MMSKASLPPARITVKRLAIWTVVLFPIVFLRSSLWFWLESRIPEWYYWKAELVFLLAAEVAYAVQVTVAVAGTVDRWLPLCASRRDRPRRAVLARPLLACASRSLLASLAAEAACGIWQYRRHRGSAMPIGGFGRNVGQAARVAVSHARRGDCRSGPIFPIRPAIVRSIWSSSANRAPRAFRSATGSRSGSILTWKMSQAIPGRPIRARVIARSGDTLEWQHRELANLPRRPDLLIIYCGHNEFTSRLAESRELAYYFDEWLPTSWDMLVEQIERSSSVCGLIRETAEKCRIAIPPAIERPPQTRRCAVLFIDRIQHAPGRFPAPAGGDRVVCGARRGAAGPDLAGGQRCGLRTEPLVSAGIDDARRARIVPSENSWPRAGWKPKTLTPPSSAIGRSWRDILALPKRTIRLARLLEQKGAWDEAYQHYVAARDRDGYPMRCLSAFQQVYRDVASRHDCILIDSQSYFHAIGRHGLLDDELFQDAMHPSLRGQIALAQAVLQALRRPASFRLADRKRRVPVIDPAECAAHFGLELRRLASHLFVGHQVQRPGCPLDLRSEPSPSGPPGVCGGRGPNRRGRCARVARPAEHRTAGPGARDPAHRSDQ